MNPDIKTVEAPATVIAPIAPPPLPEPYLIDPKDPRVLVQPPMPPTTTLAEDETTAGQRRINLVWELTQAIVALIITVSIVYCAIVKVTSPELTNAFFLIIGFYFSRTNHQAIGGIGSKPNQTYEGR